VIELGEADPRLGWRELYRRAMNIGRDHIAAVVNTLVMAYVGAALPMFLVFQIYPEPWTFTINRSFVTEEIVRSLVGSLGLVMAVPATTLIASVLYQRRFAQASHAPDASPAAHSLGTLDGTNTYLEVDAPIPLDAGDPDAALANAGAAIDDAPLPAPPERLGAVSSTPNTPPLSS
jgi:hypothetical protein